MTGEKMKKNGEAQGSYGSQVPSLLNDSPFFNISLSQSAAKSQEDGSKVTAEQKDLSNSYKQQERDSVGNTEKVGEAVNKPTKLDLKEAKAQARELQRKDPTELAERDARYLLECVQNGILNPSSYVPLRRNTPSLFIDVVTDHSNGTYVIKDYPMAATVEHLTQNMEEEDGQSYGNRRPHGLSIDDIITISKKMGDPSYIVLQENQRYAEVISFYNKQNRKVVVSIAAAENDAERSLESYFKDREVIYDKKKMNGRYQVGSGRVVTVTRDTPFIEDIVSHPTEKVKRTTIQFPLFVAVMFYMQKKIKPLSCLGQ